MEAIPASLLVCSGVSGFPGPMVTILITLDAGAAAEVAGCCRNSAKTHGWDLGPALFSLWAEPSQDCQDLQDLLRFGSIGTSSSGRLEVGVAYASGALP